MEDSGQFIAAAKHVLGSRGVPVGPATRAPLRRLTDDEAASLGRALGASTAGTAGVP
jgi:dihydrodipicolinate synthase/N-acetylneuraminate lyase